MFRFSHKQRVHLLVLCAMLGSPYAQALHPMLTDDTATAENGGYEVETAVEWAHDKNSGVSTKDAGLGISLTHGLNDTLDIGVTLAYAHSDDGSSSSGGIADTFVAMKWRFYSGDGVHLAIVPSLLLPTGDEDADQGRGELSVGANLVGTLELGDDWNVHGNLVWDHANYKHAMVEDMSNVDQWRVSVAMDKKLADGWVAAVEAGVARAEEKGGDNMAFATLGLVFSASKQLDLSVGYRFGLNDAEIDHTVLLAATCFW